MKTQVKITTYSAYEKTILHKVIPYFDKHLPKIRLDAVSAKHIQDYYVNQIGEIVKPGFVTAHFSAVLKANNLPHIRFHDLRHTAASTTASIYVHHIKTVS